MVIVHYKKYHGRSITIDLWKQHYYMTILTVASELNSIMHLVIMDAMFGLLAHGAHICFWFMGVAEFSANDLALCVGSKNKTPGISLD